MENLGELFGALALARQEFGSFTKSKTAKIKSDKGSYDYSYADLSDIIEATAGALAKHGLVVIQEPEVVSDGGRQLVIISGCIAHKSGGVYQLRALSMPVAGATAQAIGSAVSYARRYQLSAVLNLAAADDDGQAAQDAPQATQRGKEPPVDSGGHSGDVIFAKDEPVAPKRQLLSNQQEETLMELGKSFYGDAWAKEQVRLAKAVSTGAANRIADLIPKEADTLISGLRKQIAKAEQEVQGLPERVAA